MADLSVEAKSAFFGRDSRDFGRFAKIGRAKRKHGSQALDRLYQCIGNPRDTAGFFLRGR